MLGVEGPGEGSRHGQADHDDAVARERRQLEQRLAALHRGADALAKVAADHQPVERRDEPRARDLLIDELDLRVGLVDLAAHDVDVGRLVAGQRPVVFVLVLLPLNNPTQPLETELAIFEARQFLSGFHQVACP